MNNETTKRANQKGFTLLELLIVLAIIAILAVILILVLNPAETFRKARDVQRLSDLGTMKTALALYTTTVATPDLDAATAICLGSGVTTAQIAYSSSLASGSAVTCGANVAEGTDVVPLSTFNSTDSCFNVTTALAPLVDGTGWLPVNFTGIAGGSPISNLPLDPVNTTVPSATFTYSNTVLAYRYACQSTGDSTHPSTVFELDAILESAQYGPGSADDKSAKDGGDNDSYYETGSSVRLIGTGTNF